MGRRHSIVDKKMGTAASKGKLYAQMSKVIEIQAKKGQDPNLNPGLAQAVQKAKHNGVPREVIEKAIAKGAGLLDASHYTEAYYEGYGPGGCALYMKTLTDNTNRTSNAIRVSLQKYGGAIGEPGSVARQFEEKGVISISGKTITQDIKGKETITILPYDQDQLELDAINAGAEDIEFEHNICIITTSRTDHHACANDLLSLNYHIIQSDIEAFSTNPITLSEEDKQQLDILLLQLEENEDIQKIRTNII